MSMGLGKATQHIYLLNKLATVGWVKIIYFVVIVMLLPGKYFDYRMLTCCVNAMMLMLCSCIQAC